MEIIETEVMPDQIHMFVRIPPKYSVRNNGLLKRKKFAHDIREVCEEDPGIHPESDESRSRIRPNDTQGVHRPVHG